MTEQILNFSVNEQQLQKTSGPDLYASDTVQYIRAVFDLGQNWDGWDSVRAVWWTSNAKIATVLHDGECMVPIEVLTDPAKVRVNLVASTVEDDVVVDRLTSYPIVALVVAVKVRLTGDETEPITPSQFEQFVAQVEDEVELVTGMTATVETLQPGSSATASYSDGVLTLGIPRGAKGDPGQNGADGQDGHTPVKGVDYWTAQDKAEIVADVIAQLGSYYHS